jgi:hypothetical protein
MHWTKGNPHLSRVVLLSVVHIVWYLVDLEVDCLHWPARFILYIIMIKKFRAVTSHAEQLLQVDEVGGGNPGQRLAPPSIAHIASLTVWCGVQLDHSHGMSQELLLPLVASTTLKENNYISTTTKITTRIKANHTYWSLTALSLRPYCSSHLLS